MLHGRERERERLAVLLAAAREGTAGALVIRGEAGVGKSALLDDLGAAADGVQVLRAQGLESEAPLAFAGLQQLFAPILVLLDRLPGPQSRALRIAFGLEDGPAVEPFLVALATLALLVEASGSAPALCLIDDAHWLDAASADALLFAARRLHADPVALVFTARDGGPRRFEPEGIPALVLTGLQASAARTLLAEHSGAPLPDEVFRALFGHSGGNPLALVELPRTLTEQQLVGTAPLPAQLPLTDRVQRLFLDQCRRQPEQVQSLLLIAAADDSGNVAVVQRAAALSGLDAEALRDAERAQLIVTDRDSIRVRHPLVRSAMYQSATGQERRSAHRVLAEAMRSVGDPDRQAWHRAAAVDGPDDDVAAALEDVAMRAERRGGYAAAAAAFERAAELSAGDEPRAARQFGAARNRWADGQPARASALAEAARRDAEDQLLRADIDRLRGRIEINVGSAATAYRIFVGAARAVADADPSRALEVSVAASLTRLFNADAAAIAETDHVPDRPLGVRPDNTPRLRCLQRLLAATTDAGAGRWGSALDSLHAAMDASSDVTDPDVLVNLGNAALHLGDDQAHRRCFTRVLAEARDCGAGMTVLYVLPRLAFADFLSGHWSRVREAAEEALALSESVAQPVLGAAPLAWLTLLAALEGRSDYEDRRVCLDAVTGRQVGVLADAVHDLSRWAAGVHAANQGDAPAALHHLRRLRLPALARMAAPDRVDAAVRAGDAEQARRWLDDLVPFANATRWPWAQAAADHGRALICDPADAPGLFDSAINEHTNSGRPYAQARTHLAYGELLRRTQRRADARPHFRAALALFDELQAEPLASRVEQELRASGETARKRNPATLVDLTPMELRVAQLVAQGMSNKQAAAECWISPRTVAFHLRNVFSKTGVSSRGELVRLGLGTPQR